ncbi:hypothetical protein [Polaromonas sp.]|uniref:hypothetical protein n=1 Tax=Polaromonas sp. TaxID=1869339 RepID=UPI003439719E
MIRKLIPQRTTRMVWAVLNDRRSGFLLDVDNTLLDGDRIIADLHAHLESEFGADCPQRYWTIFDALREELGYVDYLGALQRFRFELKPEAPTSSDC